MEPMDTEHPDPRALERFLRGDTTPSESRQIVPHLLSGCSRCLRLTRSVWSRHQGVCGAARSREEPPVVHPASYAGLWERALHCRRRLEERVESDRRLAEGLLAELEEMPETERLPRMCGDERFASFHLCQRLAAAGEGRAEEDPHGAAALAELAIAGAESLDREAFGVSAVCDLKAAAWSALASARRHRGDLAGAERALGVAEAMLRHGSGDPLERAEVLLHRAAIRRQQRRFHEARRQLRRSRALVERLGEEHFLGRLLVEQGRVEAWAGDGARAIGSLEEGLARLDPQRGRGLALGAALELGHLLLDAGRTRRAARVVERARQLAGSDPPERRRLELARLEGRLAWARHRREQAETILTEARSGFVGAGLGHQAALATFDLAALYSRGSEPEKLRRLGEELTPVLLTGGMGVDGLAALLLLREAAESARATPGLITHLAAHLQRVSPAG